ncbi:hypothetical protein A6E92_22360 [Streptomyces sp. S8]|uniref:helix-turn-helix transcriptional regulator n=1 Tax=Streptomyces sp. S8 TaxID=1837283 RepID=UPI000A09516A|nr:hypothetical protein [Streptomyces sp. S8]ARI54608.1 hypothetical protein A6E92_22360 [Streptomyces sp. S8]
MADLNADYWTVEDIADHWGVAVQTVRSYRSRKRGELPEADKMFGRSPVWRPSTILAFQRPGRGARTDLKDAQAAAPAERANTDQADGERSPSVGN